MIGPGGLLVVVARLSAVPVSVFMGGVAKEYITKLGCEIFFRRGHILSTHGDALTIMTNEEL
jgi:hypothetical protein